MKLIKEFVGVAGFVSSKQKNLMFIGNFFTLQKTITSLSEKKETLFSLLRKRI